MVRLTVVRSLADDFNVSEEQIQSAFEKNLSALEEGLELVQAFVSIPRGEIDILALDDEKRAVVMEFKRPGESDQDALVQAMDYAFWCWSNPAWIEKFVRKTRPEFLGPKEDLSEDVRIMVVAGEYEERVKNAARAIDFPVALFSYALVPHEGEEDHVRIIPRLVLDTGRPTSKSAYTPKSEEDHLRGFEQLVPLYKRLKEIILKIDPAIAFNPAPQDYIGLGERPQFGGIHIKRRWIRLDLWHQTEHPRYRNYRPEDEWGYTHVQTEKDLDEVLISWIRAAYEKAAAANR